MEKKEFKDLCTTGLVMAFTVAVFSLVLLFLFRQPVLSRFSFPFVFIWAIPLVAFLTFLYEMLITLVRNREDAKKYLKLNILKISIELGMAVVLIVFLSWGWLGRVTGLLLAAGSTALYGIWFLYKNDYLFGKIRKDILLSELKFSVPVILMQLSMFSLFSSDSFFLSGITGDNAVVGIYGLACIFGSILITFSSALIQYMVPKINRELAKKEVSYTYIKKQFLLYSGVMTGTYFLLLFLVPLAYYFFINPLYFPGIKFYFLISTGYFLWTIATFLYRFPLFFKSKKKLIFMGIASIVVSLGSNYFFIINWGAMGAAVSVCTSYFLVLLLILLVTKDYLKQMFLNVGQKG
jgi:O-antigen/teichoic acid export membrane protein